jgi:anti-sigma B factor antagonist
MGPGVSWRAAPSRVLVAGDIDCSNAAGITEAVMALLKEHATVVVVDLSAVTFMDAAGLEALVRARNRCHEQEASLVVHCPQPVVRRLFTITGLEKLLRTPSV